MFRAWLRCRRIWGARGGKGLEEEGAANVLVTERRRQVDRPLLGVNGAAQRQPVCASRRDSTRKIACGAALNRRWSERRCSSVSSPAPPSLPLPDGDRREQITLRRAAAPCRAREAPQAEPVPLLLLVRSGRVEASLRHARISRNGGVSEAGAAPPHGEEGARITSAERTQSRAFGRLRARRRSRHTSIAPESGSAMDDGAEETASQQTDGRLERTRRRPLEGRPRTLRGCARRRGGARGLEG